jgi:tetratricopeptide (TPR) repeat protein
MVLVDLDRRDEALKEFSQAVAIDPNNFIAYVYSAGIKHDSGDYEGAEKEYNALVKLNSSYYYAFEGLGILKMRKQQWAEARDAFLEAYKYAPKEYTYVLLAAVNWMRAGNTSDPKQFLTQVLRNVPRETTNWYLIRLFNDMAGDTDVAMRIDKEKDPEIKTRMLFYLANFYDVRGNKPLADKYFLQAYELDYHRIPEWRIIEWFAEDRKLKVF